MTTTKFHNYPIDPSELKAIGFKSVFMGPTKGGWTMEEGKYTINLTQMLYIGNRFWPDWECTMEIHWLERPYESWKSGLEMHSIEIEINNFADLKTAFFKNGLIEPQQLSL